MKHLSHPSIIVDLREFVRLLKKYEFFPALIEPQNINSLLKSSNEIFYQYDTNDIVFNVTASGMNSNPQVKKLVVILNVKYKLKETLSTSSDIFEYYNFNIFIKGYWNKNASVDDDSNFFCWHLDREPATDGNFIHPYYHFHAGGHHIGDRNPGDLLLISSPRLPHPPMDIFLAIHFVILNFFNTKDFRKQKNILSDELYLSIIERAQKRVLDPYFTALNADGHEDYSKYNLFPLAYS
jgi:hypothetical protein